MKTIQTTKPRSARAGGWDWLEHFSRRPLTDIATATDFSGWDCRYEAVCPHGVDDIKWDAIKRVPLCECEEVHSDDDT